MRHRDTSKDEDDRALRPSQSKSPNNLYPFLDNSRTLELLIAELKRYKDTDSSPTAPKAIPDRRSNFSPDLKRVGLETIKKRAERQVAEYSKSTQCEIIKPDNKQL